MVRTVFYATAFPTLALLVCQNRVFATIFAFIGLIVIIVFIIPLSDDFTRVLISYALYHAFIIASHWVHELTERRMCKVSRFITNFD